MGDNRSSNGIYTVVRQYVMGFGCTTLFISVLTVFLKSYNRMRRMVDCISQLTLVIILLNKTFNHSTI